MFALATFLLAASAAALPEPIAFVPLDDRPITSRLPHMLGRIAGRSVVEPPRAALGRYLEPGKPAAILGWLNGSTGANAYAISSDMLAYGGLVASRAAGVTARDAAGRIGAIQSLRARHPRAWIGVFGTIMRLAPTNPSSDALTRYANLHDPPLPAEQDEADRLRREIGDAALNAYIATRRRDLDVDLSLLRLTAQGSIDRVALGQDDAGPVGIHAHDVFALQSAIAESSIGDRASVEPGADELGMTMVAHALTIAAGWVPRIAVRYSMPAGASTQDPLEFAPIEAAINALIGVAGGERDDVAPDLTLYVRVPGTTALQDGALLDAMRADVDAGRSVALADLTFLEKDRTAQARFVQELLARHLGGRIDAYASGVTNANTVGAALAEAIAAGAGRRTHRYDALAHAEFTFEQYLNDYLYADYVRPRLNWVLDERGVTAHSSLPAQEAAALERIAGAELRTRALALLPRVYPQYRLASMAVSLPWYRTFEAEIQLRLAPTGGRSPN